MSTKSKTKKKSITTETSKELSVKDLTALLIKHYGFTSGMFDLMLEFRIGVGPAGPSSEEICPSAIIGVSKFGLVESKVIGPLSVDAAIVNPSC